MDNGLKEIHFHDSWVESVLELPIKDQLVFNVQYPTDWENNKFEPKSIIFHGLVELEVKEIPFEGNPTILDAFVIAKDGGYTTFKLETNAGYRLVKAKSVTLEDRIGGV